MVIIWENDIIQYKHMCCVGHRYMSDTGTRLIRGVSLCCIGKETHRMCDMYNSRNGQTNVYAIWSFCWKNTY
jgi:hypothetical protein